MDKITYNGEWPSMQEGEVGSIPTLIPIINYLIKIVMKIKIDNIILEHVDNVFYIDSEIFIIFNDNISFSEFENITKSINGTIPTNPMMMFCKRAMNLPKELSRKKGLEIILNYEE